MLENLVTFAKNTTAHRIRILTNKEADALIDSCRAAPCDKLYPLVSVIMATGAHLEELFFLRWRDVDLENGAVVFTHISFMIRRLPIPSDVRDMLRALRQKLSKDEESFVFGKAGSLDAQKIESAWALAIHSAGLEGFRFEDLRYLFAYRQAKLGMTKAEIQHFMGARIVGYFGRTELHPSYILRHGFSDLDVLYSQWVAKEPGNIK